MKIYKAYFNSQQVMSKTTILEPVNRTLTGWNKSEISLLNYQRYILKKADKFRLGLIDLLYVSNFKGEKITINDNRPSTKIEQIKLLVAQHEGVPAGIIKLSKRKLLFFGKF